jgi:septum formation protein
MRLLLASASPRRAELLSGAGFEFDIEPAHVDESIAPGEQPEAYVQRVARAKAAAVAAQAHGRIVLAADTIVVIDGKALGKPLGRSDAERMLRLLSGRRHDVLTGVALLNGATGGGSPLVAVETTTVEFTQLSDNDIEWYVASGECTDKAGAYAIQGLASRFVRRIEGSYSNVVGLPIALVSTMLKALS